MQHVHFSAKVGAIVAVAVLTTGGAIAGASTQNSRHHPPGHSRGVTSPPVSVAPGSFLRQLADVTFPAPYVNPTSFDIGYVDANTETYYLADRTNNGIDAINSANNTFGSVIGAGDFSGNNTGANIASAAQVTACGASGTGGPNGVLSLDVGGVRQLVGANGVSAAHPVSNVEIFTLSTPTSGTLSATVPTAVSANGTAGTCRADEMAYDPNDNLLIVANDIDPTPYVSFISIHANPSLDAVVGQIKFPNAIGGIEQSVYDTATHRFIVNIPGVEVARIDPSSLRVDATYPTSNCAASGLALDEQNQEMLLSCALNAKGVEFMNARNGKVINFVPQVSGADEVWFDPGTNNFYLGANHMTSSGTAVPAVTTTGSGTSWTIAESGATGGTFTVAVGTATTAPIATNASASAVATAIDAVVPGATVSGGPLPSSETVTFATAVTVFTANGAGLTPAGYVTPVIGVIAAGSTNASSGHRNDQKSVNVKPTWVENVPEPTTQGSHSVAADPVNGNVLFPLSGSGVAVFGWVAGS